MQEISLCDISGIMTKAPCEAALMGEHHVRIEIADFVMRTFAPFGGTAHRRYLGCILIDLLSRRCYDVDKN